LKAPAHGGNLSEAVRRFGRPREQWLDLSTGINPHPYPVAAAALAPDAWHRLPDAAAGTALAEAARTYYNAPQLLAVAGTQAAIQALPQCRLQSAGRAHVVIAGPTYAEHAHRWAKSGHRIAACGTAREDIDRAAASPAVDVIVICNPNNPSGALFEPAQLLEWHALLAERGGWLVVDEAFGDTVPQASVAAFAERAGLIVLKSVGKFFGLAGLRLGFIAADRALLALLADMIGPWSVSGPAQQIGRAAFEDSLWQQDTRRALAAEGARLGQLLRDRGIENHGTALFRWSPLPARQAEALWLHLARNGIWARLFDGDGISSATGLRLGLPGDESGWQRLDDALAAWRGREVAP
jgi:cobalamin biosynthetic protein CobC